MGTQLFSLLNCVSFQQSDVIHFRNMRHCNKNGSMFDAATIAGMACEVNNNSADCSALNFVDSHGTCNVKGKMASMHEFWQWEREFSWQRRCSICWGCQFVSQCCHHCGKGGDCCHVLLVNIVASAHDTDFVWLWISLFCNWFSIFCFSNNDINCQIMLNSKE